MTVSKFRMTLPGMKADNQSWLWRILGVLFIAYILITVVRGIWQNAKLAQEGEQVKKEITQLKTDNQKLSRSIDYQKTQTFREKEARLKLGYKAPGETAVVVPETRVNRSDEPLVTTNDQNTDTRPNWQKWEEYFFPPR